jgi:hypothetical protein
MADVSAIFGSLLSLGIVFPGMLTAWWLLFPAMVERARQRLDRTPWHCFWLGGLAAAGAVIPIVILLALPLGPARLAGWGLIFLVLALASFGAAGLAARMAAQLHKVGGAGTPLGAFVRGAVALELAAAFPVVGWLVVIPLAVVTALGAALFAVLRWAPALAAPPAAGPAVAVSSRPG